MPLGELARLDHDAVPASPSAQTSKRQAQQKHHDPDNDEDQYVLRRRAEPLVVVLVHDTSTTLAEPDQHGKASLLSGCDASSCRPSWRASPHLKMAYILKTQVGVLDRTPT
jgi:hypothetical protein